MGPGWWYFGLRFVGWKWPPAAIFVPHFGKNPRCLGQQGPPKSENFLLCRTCRWTAKVIRSKLRNCYRHVKLSGKLGPKKSHRRWSPVGGTWNVAKIFRWMSCLATFLVVDEWVGMTKPTTKPVSDLKMLKTLPTGFLSINICSFVDLPNSTNTLVTCCFLRCKTCEIWKTSTFFCFLCLSSSCLNQRWFCEAKLLFGIFLCCRFPFSFFAPGKKSSTT